MWRTPGMYGGSTGVNVFIVIIYLPGTYCTHASVSDSFLYLNVGDYSMMYEVFLLGKKRGVKMM